MLTDLGILYTYQGKILGNSIKNKSGKEVQYPEFYCRLFFEIQHLMNTIDISFDFSES
jgi:hypothetical protein